jgi:DNA-binding NarL/FixJ family response regulator
VLVESAPDLEVVGEAASGEEAVALARRERPDLVLMDIRMPVLDGIEATRRISSDPDLAGTRVLVLTTFDADDYVFEALRSGAAGFVLKDIEPPDLLAAIRIVAAGESLLAPSVTSRLIAEFTARASARPGAPAGLADLTEREREILQHVGLGRSNDEIAAELFLSPATVKTHVSRVMSKLYAHDRAQLVIAAYESGLVVAGRPPALRRTPEHE